MRSDAGIARSYSNIDYYPFFIADVMLDWTKEYGNIFQLRLLTDNRVRDFPQPWRMKSDFP